MSLDLKGIEIMTEIKIIKISKKINGFLLYYN